MDGVGNMYFSATGEWVRYTHSLPIESSNWFLRLTFFKSRKRDESSVALAMLLLHLQASWQLCDSTPVQLMAVV